ncbi:ATP synthase D chain isoform X1 [Wolffia australiana]
MKLAKSSPTSAALSTKSIRLCRPSTAWNRSLSIGNIIGKELALAWWICTRRRMKVCSAKFSTVLSASSLHSASDCLYIKVLMTRFSLFKGIEVPKFLDTVTPEYKPKFEAMLVELKEAEQKSLKESERLEKEIAEVQEMKKKISTMTADEYFEKHPELRKKFDDEIRNDFWGY